MAFILLVIVYFYVPEDTGVTPQDDEGVFSEVLMCEGLHDLCLRGAQHVHRLQPQSVRVKETKCVEWQLFSAIHQELISTAVELKTSRYCRLAAHNTPYMDLKCILLQSELQALIYGL